eukprot:gene6148-8475_t
MLIMNRTKAIKFKSCRLGVLFAQRGPSNFTPIVQFNNNLILLRPMSGTNLDPNNNNEEKKMRKPETLYKQSITAVKHVVDSTLDMIFNPRATWKMVVEVMHHYWLGSKLLWSEVKVARHILGRIAKGHAMTRRERMQLIRTSTDIFRLVPFAIFVIVPFMEFLLPFALKIFPNMLPSTFQDSLKKEENMKKELQMRLAVAKFMQETLQEMAIKKKKEFNNTESSGAKELVDFIERARLGEPLPNETVIRIAQLFEDELTLSNVPRPQLVSMCTYMGLQPYGADAFLRFQLRNKLRGLKEDDRRILWEGIDSLDTLELREACRERGMISIGLTHFKYKNQLQQWLDLSIQKNIPISLLIMSRAFFLTAGHPASDKTVATAAEDILRSSISSLDSDTINEIVIAAASPAEQNSIDIRKRKLDSIQFQQEMIEEEREDSEDALASKKPIGGNEAKSNAVVNKASTEPNFSPSLKLSDNDTQASKEKEKSQQKSELTVEEAEALSDLARGSSVQREKAELAILLAGVESTIPPLPSTALGNNITKDKSSQINYNKEANLVHSNINDITDNNNNNKSTQLINSNNSNSASRSAPSMTVGSIPSINDGTATIDPSLTRMKKVIDSMLGKLKIQIDSTEKAVGDKLNLLDLDGDGELSSDELKEAIVKTLKRTSSVQEAEELFAILDKDKDGK